MKSKVTFPVTDTFSLDQTFSCGQCFRWEQLAPEIWRGVAFSREVTLSLSGRQLTASCTREEFEKLWRPYLDLDRDYAAIRQAVSTDPHTADAVEYGAGIRILRQEPWEALCSFILSQCNNIPRIRGIIARLCAHYGEEIRDGVHAFPAPGRLAVCGIEELRGVIRCGYRASYVIAAAQAVESGALDLETLGAFSTKTARERLTTLHGVGKKVADCVLLFGLQKLDAFPVDVWMRRTIDSLYGRNFDPAAAFGPYAGVAQQYLFYHARAGIPSSSLHE